MIKIDRYIISKNYNSFDSIGRATYTFGTTRVNMSGRAQREKERAHFQTNLRNERIEIL